MARSADLAAPDPPASVDPLAGGSFIVPDICTLAHMAIYAYAHIAICAYAHRRMDGGRRLGRLLR